MARGGQLGVATVTPTPWWKYLLYVLGGLLVIWILYKAFAPCPPSIVKKEGFQSGCPCAKKNGGGSVWRPFATLG